MMGLIGQIEGATLEQVSSCLHDMHDEALQSNWLSRGQEVQIVDGSDWETWQYIYGIATDLAMRALAEGGRMELASGYRGDLERAAESLRSSAGPRPELEPPLFPPETVMAGILLWDLAAEDNWRAPYVTFQHRNMLVRAWFRVFGPPDGLECEPSVYERPLTIVLPVE